MADNQRVSLECCASTFAGGYYAKILNDFASVARGRILDFQNWQAIYSNAASVTVTRPDRTQFTGPSWGYMADQYNNKANSSDVLRKTII